MKRTAVLIGCVVMLAATTQAVQVSNVTSNVVVFYDDFEHPAITPSTANAYDGSVDADPIATVGTWTINEDDGQGIVQVTTSGPAQGSRDLRVYRDAAHNAFSLKATLMSVQATAGDMIHLNMMVYIPASQNVDYRGQFILEGSAPYAWQSARAWVFTKTDGFVHIIGPGFVDTGTSVTYATDTWQEWTLDYAVNSATFSFSVAGVSGSGTSPTTGDVKGAELINGNTTAGSFYLDAFPEPTSVALLVLGGLMAWRGRRR